MNRSAIEIRKLVEGWAKAIRDGNMNDILAHHTKDVVMFDVPLPLQSVGIEAYKKTWDLFFNTVRAEKVRSNSLN